MTLGAIADDFTGGTDVAVAFRRSGLRTVLLFGAPAADEPLPPHDAVVVALKTRTIDPAEAVRQSVAAATWLREHGADQLYFKYCSTFDSRPTGNIGPVADALAALLGARHVIVAPASPDHLRTQYMGTLFVDRSPLAESPMRHHPLTPMTDSSVPRLLDAQTSAGVSLVDLRTVRAGGEQLRRGVEAAAGSGARYLVVDALTDDDLAQIGQAVVDDVLVTGAAGLARGLGAARFAKLGLAPATEGTPSHPVADGSTAVRAAVLAGSCSARTLEQVERMRSAHPSFLLDAVATPDSQALADAALAWYDTQPADGPAALIYSSIAPAQLARAQQILGVERASELLETGMGLVARGLVERGVSRLVIAGGETSGAVVTALDVRAALMGEEAAPGVPWIYSTGPERLELLLKSGNFGDPDLLTRSVETGAPERQPA